MQAISRLRSDIAHLRQFILITVISDPYAGETQFHTIQYALAFGVKVFILCVVSQWSLFRHWVR
jgi:hypothetical protein